MPDESTKPGPAARLLDALDAVAKAFIEYRSAVCQLPLCTLPRWDAAEWDSTAWCIGAAAAKAKFDAARDAALGSKPLFLPTWQMRKEAEEQLKDAGAPVAALDAVGDAVNWLRVAGDKCLTGKPRPVDYGQRPYDPSEDEIKFDEEWLFFLEYYTVRARLAWH
ncbi:MAG: hypothetical protein FJ304_25925, partial [Planctomycetes bacterium]|nr:hypothetical protein [Planctomycetota bacterium]